MKMKEKLQIIALALLIIVVIVMYFTNDSAYAKGTENDGKVFTVYKFKYDEEIGYTPIGETSMSMDRLRSWVKICYFTAEKLDSGDIILKFEADLKERWIVKISDRAVIKELKMIETDYRLKCTIPD